MVGTDYDPMLAKVIAHGPDRPAALRRLDRALGELAAARRDDQRRLLARAARARGRARRRDRHRPARAGARRARRRRRPRTSCPPPRSARRRHARPPAGPVAAAPRGARRGARRRRRRCAPASATWRADVRAGAGELRARRARRRRARATRSRATATRCGSPATATTSSCASPAPRAARPPTAPTRWRRRCRAPCCWSTSPTATTSRRGEVLLVIESMKMELSIAAPHGGHGRRGSTSRSATRSACARRWRSGGTAGRRVSRASATGHLELIEDLEARLARVRAGGGERARERHTSRGKLLARERVERLCDPGAPFLELSPLAAEELYDGAAPGAGHRHRRRRGRGPPLRGRRQRRDRQGRHLLPDHGQEAPAGAGGRAPQPAPVHLPRRLRRRVPAHAGRGLPRPRALRPHLLQPGDDVGARRSRRSAR